ncbi:MAG: zinc ABC transporter substrate-binding protein [Hyphomicrobium sp.]
MASFAKFLAEADVTATRVLPIGALVAASAALATLVSAPALAKEPKVVVTMKPIHALVASVMSGVGVPKLIVDGTASPHTFTLKPSGAKAVNEADVFIRISDSIEPFTRKVVGSLPKTVTLVTLAETSGLTLLDQREGGSFEEHEHHDGEGHEEHADHGKKEAGHDHDDHDDHKKSGEHAAADQDDDHDREAKDGHIWLDTSNAKLIVESVASTLAAKYPEHADAFKSNAAATVEKIEKLTTEIEALTGPVKGRPFIVFHDATQYFENRFGLAAAGSITVSPDVQPSAKRLTEVRKKIASLEAVCVFTEPGFQPKLVAAVTEGTKARSGSLDAEGAMLKPGPDLYFDLMRGMARNLSDCLRPAT